MTTQLEKRTQELIRSEVEKLAQHAGDATIVLVSAVVAHRIPDQATADTNRDFLVFVECPDGFLAHSSFSIPRISRPLCGFVKEE